MNMMDFEVERCTRRCAETGQPLAEGAEFYSVLLPAGAEIKRQDFSLAAWKGPPENAIGWWKSKIPQSDDRTPKLAPSDILLKLFCELETSTDERDLRYVLALLMIRRRLFRLEDTIPDEQGGEVMMLYCSRDEKTHHVPIVMPSDARVDEIQNKLATLLYVGGKSS